MQGGRHASDNDELDVIIVKLIEDLEKVAGHEFFLGKAPGAGPSNPEHVPTISASD